MLSLYEILKASKTGIAPDMWTALAGMNWGGADSGAEVKELTGIPPLSIRSNGTMLLDYLISGNMTQSGTPTPSNPVDVNGVGERTENLLKNDAISTESRGVQYTVNADKSITVYGTASSQISYFILMGDGAATNDLSAYTTPIFKAGDTLKFSSGSSIYKLRGRNTNGTYVNVLDGTVTLSKDLGLIYIQVAVGATADETIYPMITLSTETDTDYEPYGIKIPISSGGENLFDKTANYDVGGTTYNYTISGLDPDKYYTCSTNFERISGVSTASLYFNGGISLDNGVWSDTPRTFKPNYNGEIIVYIRHKADAGAPVIYDDIMAGTIWVMVNEGSEALPYEPYNRTTTPIYLGEVESTRRIRKLVLDGTENWTITANKFYYITLSSYPINWLAAITSHFEVREDISATGCARFGGTASVPKNTFVFNYDNGAGGITSWKSYLATQYANGTPVTIWYVLATETTGIVNEPLRKIGDYADTLSMEQAGVQIPTNRGNTVIDVETTLKPSEMYIKYKG